MHTFTAVTRIQDRSPTSGRRILRRFVAIRNHERTQIGIGIRLSWNYSPTLDFSTFYNVCMSCIIRLGCVRYTRKVECCLSSLRERKHEMPLAGRGKKNLLGKLMGPKEVHVGLAVSKRANNTADQSINARLYRRPSGNRRSAFCPSGV